MGLVLDLDDLIGADEAAQLAGFKNPKHLHTYVARGRFPPPVKKLGTCYGWSRWQVLDAGPMGHNWLPGD